MYLATKVLGENTSRREVVVRWYLAGRRPTVALEADTMDVPRPVLASPMLHFLFLPFRSPSTVSLPPSLASYLFSMVGALPCKEKSALAVPLSV